MPFNERRFLVAIRYRVRALPPRAPRQLLHGGSRRSSSLTHELPCVDEFKFYSAILEALPQLELQLVPQNDARRNIILSLPGQIETNSLPLDVADAIRGLWRDPAVKEAVRRSREFQLNDSAV